MCVTRSLDEFWLLDRYHSSNTRFGTITRSQGFLGYIASKITLRVLERAKLQSYCRESDFGRNTRMRRLILVPGVSMCPGGLSASWDQFRMDQWMRFGTLGVFLRPFLAKPGLPNFARLDKILQNNFGNTC